MRHVSQLALAVLFLAACEERKKSAVAPAVDLVRVGSIGDLPVAQRGQGPATAGCVVSVGLDKEGGLWLRGPAEDAEWRRLSYAEFAKAPELRRPQGKEPVHAVLHVDRAVPWDCVGWILLVLADPGVRISRTSFAVLPPQGEEVGALALFLPEDRGLEDAETQTKNKIRAQVRVRRDPPEAERGALAARVSAALAPSHIVRRVSYAEVSVDGLVTLDSVLRTVDAILRAGMPTIGFVGPVPRMGGGADPFQEALAASREKPTPSGAALRLNGEDVVPARGDPPLAEVPRVRGGLAGSTSPNLMDMIELDEVYEPKTK